MSRYKLCEECTIRNCRRKPKTIETPWGYSHKCFKRAKIKGGFSFVEMAIGNSPIQIMTLVHDHGLQITETKKGLRVSRRKNGS